MRKATAWEKSQTTSVEKAAQNDLLRQTHEAGKYHEPLEKNYVYYNKT